MLNRDAPDGSDIDLSDVIVNDVTGAPVRLGDLVVRPTVVDLVRYYGCAPCRQQLMALGARYEAIANNGGDVIGIGPRAAYQARLLVDRRHIPFPLLLDPEHQVGRAVGLGRQPLLRWIFDLRAWGRWLMGLLRAGQGLVTGGWWEVPAILVLDGNCRVRWSHLGRSMGDYPPITEILAQLERVIDR